MVTKTPEGRLEELLERLGLDIPVPHFLEADVLTKPLDIGRVYLANILSSLVENNAANAYRSIQWPGDINNGDLAVILPKFSPGAKVDVLALDLMKRVYFFTHILLCLGLTSPSSFRHVHFSFSLSMSRKVFIFASCSRLGRFHVCYCRILLIAKAHMANMLQLDCMLPRRLNLAVKKSSWNSPPQISPANFRESISEAPSSALTSATFTRQWAGM